MLSKLKAILMLAWLLGMSVECYRRMCWLQFRIAAREIWKM